MRRLLLLLCLIPWLTAGIARAQQSPARNVLLIYPHEQEMASYATLDQALRSTLQLGTPFSIEYYSEYLDLLRFSEGARLEGLVDYLRVKYSGRRIDLIVVVSSMGLEFLLERGDELFPGVPIVFTSVNTNLVQQLTLRPNITGIAVRRVYSDTVDMILRLQPDTTEIVIPVGSSAREKAWAPAVKDTLEPYRGRVALTYLDDLSMSAVLARISRLPRHSVVLFSPLFFTDAAGRYYLPEESLRLMTEASAVPVYGTDDHHLGRGIVGGALYDIAASGAEAGRLGGRILSGESVAKIPVQTLNPSHNMVDARQLARWGISEARLPPGTLVSYREASTWDLYKGYILGCATVLLLQASLIVMLAAAAKAQAIAIAAAGLERLPDHGAGGGAEANRARAP